MIGFETFYFDTLQRFSDHSFYIPKLFGFIRADQGDRISCGSGPACTANTVDVVFRYVWQIEIDHHW